MKLELKHLAPYLPYGLRCQNPISKTISEMKPFDVDMIIKSQDNPILRPLSDLVKEIEVNGEKFVPTDYFEDKYYTLDLHKQCERIIEDENWINQSDYMLIDYLFEWHFDVFGLIDAGLAIDINTLTND